MRGCIYDVYRVLIVGFQDQVILDVQIGTDLAVCGSFVREEISAFDEKRRRCRKFLFECVYIADTPCQPPNTGRLSATRFQAAVYIACKVQDKGCTVVGAESGISRSVLTHDLEAASIFLLRDVRANPLQGKAPTAYDRNNRNEDELDWFESFPAVHCVQL